jgi:hypothetical protein
MNPPSIFSERLMKTYYIMQQQPSGMQHENAEDLR